MSAGSGPRFRTVQLDELERVPLEKGCWRPGAGLPPSPFEFWYAAIPASEAGDHERAYEIVAEGLEHYPEHGTLHYVLGCEAALSGRRAEALDHLRIGFANDPRARTWAESDSDLDALRGDPEFPR